MNKKAQLSMETVMIYGAVLLVVTLAIGALIYFGVLDLGGLLPDKCETGGKIICNAYKASSDIQLELTNKVGKNIDMLDVSIVGVDDWVGVDCNKDYATKGGVDIDGSGSGARLFNGENAIFSCTPSGTIPDGQKYSGRININYKTADSGLEQSAVGTLQVTVTP